MIIVNLITLLKAIFNKLKKSYLVITPLLEDNYLEYILLKINKILISLV